MWEAKRWLPRPLFLCGHFTAVYVTHCEVLPEITFIWIVLQLDFCFLYFTERCFFLCTFMLRQTFCACAGKVKLFRPLSVRERKGTCLLQYRAQTQHGQSFLAGLRRPFAFFVSLRRAPRPGPSLLRSCWWEMSRPVYLGDRWSRPAASTCTKNRWLSHQESRQRI